MSRTSAIRVAAFAGTAVVLVSMGTTGQARAQRTFTNFTLTVCDRLGMDLGQINLWSVTLTGLDPTVDVDDNGTFGALTDGLLLLRYAFGLRGAALISGAVGVNCGRCTAQDIERFLRSLADEP